MPRRLPVLILKDMIQCLQDLSVVTQGHSYRTFIADVKTFHAVRSLVTLLGEAANQLPQDVRDISTDLPWAELRGVPNRLVHEYFDIDSALLWKIATLHAPLLKQPLSRLLEILVEKSSD